MAECFQKGDFVRARAQVISLPGIRPSEPYNRLLEHIEKLTLGEVMNVDKYDKLSVKVLGCRSSVSDMRSALFGIPSKYFELVRRGEPADFEVATRKELVDLLIG